MKINKQFVQEVAGGKYGHDDSHGEMKEAARFILEEKLVSRFASYCFRIYGREMPDNVMDIYDAFVDFPMHGAQIDIDVQDEKYRYHTQIFGIRPEYTLEELWRLYSECNNEWLKNQLASMRFKIKGEPGLYEMNLSAMHSIFDHGRAPQRYVVKACRVA